MDSRPNINIHQSGRTGSGIYRKYIKRLIDIICSLLGIIILSPILLITALLVRIKLGGPVVFKQKRPGLNEKIFTMYKFRTMTDKKDQHGELLPDSLRLTKFGSFLRSSSLDELLELFNILNGSMSIIGPRPQLVRDMVFMTKEQRKRHNVTPGLSGLAQVNGRNSISWEEKFIYDLKYIDNITFVGDCKILWKTIVNVFTKQDINTEGMATAEDFGDYLLRHNRITKEEYNEKIQESHRLLE